MKTFVIILGILTSFLAVLTSCQEDADNKTSSLDTEITQRQDQNFIDNIDEAVDSHLTTSDPFHLNSVVLQDSALHISVTYGGGCETHAFQMIWPEMITYIYPPRFDVILAHEGNGDMCKAMVTETLIFDLTNNPLGMNTSDFYIMSLGIVNASNPDQRIELDNK